MGQVDLKLVETKIPDLISTSDLNLQVTVGGTTDVPDLRGNAVYPMHPSESRDSSRD